MRCVEVFVEDQFMFRFVSKQSKISIAVQMSSLIFSGMLVSLKFLKIPKYFHLR